MWPWNIILRYFWLSFTSVHGYSWKDKIWYSSRRIIFTKWRLSTVYLSFRYISRGPPYDQWSVFGFIDWASDQMADQRRFLDRHQNRFSKLSRMLLGCKIVSRKTKIWPFCFHQLWRLNMANIVLNGIVTVKSLRIGTSSFITYEPISLSWLVLNLWHESNNKVPSEPVDKVKRQIKLSLFKGTFCSST